MIKNCQWIKPPQDPGDVVPLFSKTFSFQKAPSKVTLSITALGVYEASLNGQRIGDFILAPGWTAYDTRLQYQTYDVTNLVQKDNTIQVLVGKGWYRSRLVGWQSSDRQKHYQANPAGLIACLNAEYPDGTTETISTDETWTVQESPVRFSEIYDGEVYDAVFKSSRSDAACTFNGPANTLIPQEGPQVTEQERVQAAGMFTTPDGDIVIDFGQEVTGYVELSVNASASDVVDLSFAEVMDKNGNFYNENYRSAKCQYHYTCKDGEQTWHPLLTFYGFRYIRINEFPGGAQNAKPENFTAIVIHSQMKRTGYVSCSHPLLNKLFSNCVWGQKGNFVDVPTDCPQRDERLGWTGDAQVFTKTAALNYDVEKFFTKWLADMAADQHEDGRVGHVIPDLLQAPDASAAWGDAAAICPWEIYLAYGNKQILENQWDCMQKWVGYITSATTTPYLWTGGEHFGDWLGLDAPVGSYKGSSSEDFIASAFYAYSTALTIKAGTVLGKDVAYYESLYRQIVNTFRSTFTEYHTQTECAVAVYFHLAPDPAATARQLADMVMSCGTKLQTGFVGTPYLLHVLSSYGYIKLAYDLLLRTEYPSWLYPVTKGATTIWEHWDGIMEDGNFWSADMNSYNHYAYGSVLDWVYTVSAGIQTMEDYPGYEKVRIAPHPDDRLDFMTAQLDTRHGKAASSWRKDGNRWRYDITTPVDAEITIAGETKWYPAGEYIFYSDL